MGRGEAINNEHLEIVHCRFLKNIVLLLESRYHLRPPGILRRVEGRGHAMKVFVLGGVTLDKDEDEKRWEDEKGKLQRFCGVLGRLLGESEHQIVLCSCHPSSADYLVLEGLRDSPKGRTTERKLIVHRPDDEVIRKDWQDVKRDFGIVSPVFQNHRGPEFRAKDGKTIESPEGLKLAFLLCQIKAKDDCDVILTVGGKLDGPAVLLLAMAREQGRIILPYRFLGGAAERTYEKLEVALRSRLGSDGIEKLSEIEEGASAALELIGKLSGALITAPARVFLSYPWKKSEYADLVEAILRRNERVTVFRDEKDIRQGESIDSRIEEEIRTKCSIFIALWCREYVESPYCHDEMELWLKHRKMQNFYLLRFDETRPVWRSLRNQEDDRETFNALWLLVGTERVKVVKALDDILRDFKDRVIEPRE